MVLSGQQQGTLRALALVHRTAAPDTPLTWHLRPHASLVRRPPKHVRAEGEAY